MNSENLILTINAGSSSIKIAVYDMKNDKPVIKLSAKIEHIGTVDGEIIIKENSTQSKYGANTKSFHAATKSLIEWLEKQCWFLSVIAVGHRIVHGMRHTSAEVITDDLLSELESIIDYDPDHLPSEIEIVKIFRLQHPQLLQIACFDTAFHTSIPAVAKTFAIPKSYSQQGIQRYGFHGISYSYLMKELHTQSATLFSARVILAHLGNGASLAAVKEGKCIDTSMGFTPAGGIVMSSRSGDIDPGIAWFLMRKGMNAKDFNHLINHQSGLLGISGISSDMQQLLKQEQISKDAALAVEIFCYQIKKYIGAYSAALNGLDVLVFSGGIGENAAEIRVRICEGLAYLGVEINEEKNANNEREISTDESRVKVYVIATNEELMIAATTSELYKEYNKNN
ncbi:MAG TPA: acetate/propionate family kinase [Arachidicoccus sp.]